MEKEFDLVDLVAWGKCSRSLELRLPSVKRPSTCPACERFSLDYSLSESPILEVGLNVDLPTPESLRAKRELDWYKNVVGFTPKESYSLIDEQSVVGTVTMTCPICSKEGRQSDDPKDVSYKMFLVPITRHELAAYMASPIWPEHARPDPPPILRPRCGPGYESKMAALRRLADTLQINHRGLPDREFVELFDEIHSKALEKNLWDEGPVLSM